MRKREDGIEMANTAEIKPKEKLGPEQKRTNVAKDEKARKEKDQHTIKRIKYEKEDTEKKIEKKAKGDGTKKSRETKETQKKQSYQNEEDARRKGCKQRKESTSEIINAAQAVDVKAQLCYSSHDEDAVDTTQLMNQAVDERTRKSAELHRPCKKISRTDSLKNRRNKKRSSCNGRKMKEHNSTTEHNSTADVVKVGKTVKQDHFKYGRRKTNDEKRKSSKQRQVNECSTTTTEIEQLSDMKELPWSEHQEEIGLCTSKKFVSLDEEAFGDLLKTSDELMNFLLEIESNISQLDDIQQQIQIGRENFDTTNNRISTDLIQVSSSSAQPQQKRYDLANSQDSEEIDGTTSSIKQKEHLHTSTSDRRASTWVAGNPYSDADPNRRSFEECLQEPDQQTRENSPKQSAKSQEFARQNGRSRHESNRLSRSAGRCSRSLRESHHRKRRSLEESDSYSRGELEESSSHSRNNNRSSHSRRSRLTGQKYRSESSLLKALHKQDQEPDEQNGGKDKLEQTQQVLPTFEIEMSHLSSSLTVCTLMREEDSEEESVATKESVSERSRRTLLNLSQKLEGSFRVLSGLRKNAAPSGGKQDSVYGALSSDSSSTSDEEDGASSVFDEEGFFDFISSFQ